MNKKFFIRLYVIGSILTAIIVFLLSYYTGSKFSLYKSITISFITGIFITAYQILGDYVYKIGLFCDQEREITNETATPLDHMDPGEFWKNPN